jgi:glycosyltransferase involved in cell wall biosynthesis
MRILFFLHYPNPFPGAAWRRIEFFANKFAKKGHIVSVAGSFSPKSLKMAGFRTHDRTLLVNMIPMIMIPNIVSSMLTVVSSFVISLFLIACLRPDVAIISVPNGDAGLGSYRAAKLSKRKIVFDYRDEWEDHLLSQPRSRLYKRYYESLKVKMSECYQNSNLVITVTESIRNSLSTRGVKDIKVVTNGADTSLFKPRTKSVIRHTIGVDDNDFAIIYSGTLGVYYRIDLLVRALSQLDFKDVKLLVLGEGPALEDIKKLSKEAGVDGIVRVLGTKDKEELAEIISACDLGVVPFDNNILWKNALPAKFFEYLSCGVPVLATVYRDSLIADLIGKHQIGFTTEPEDVDALQTRLAKIYQERELLTEMGKKARALIEDRFDREKIADEFLQMLISLNANH